MITLFSNSSSNRNNSIFTLLMRIAHNQSSAWVEKMGPARADMGWWDVEKLVSKICISPHSLSHPHPKPLDQCHQNKRWCGQGVGLRAACGEVASQEGTQCWEERAATCSRDRTTHILNSF